MKQRQVHVRQAGSARHRRSLTGVLAMFGILVGTVVAIVGGSSLARAMPVPARGQSLAGIERTAEGVPRCIDVREGPGTRRVSLALPAFQTAS